VCLLIALWQVVEGAPLIVAANRDERYDRPATPMTVLREAGPRILGGQDLAAGGTWLAVSEAGLVAGLTNRPAPQGRDPARRSRGELPIALARRESAAAAAGWAAAAVRPEEYNPCWILAGDRESLHYLDLTAGPRPRVRALPPGIHVLENEPLGGQSAKAAHVAGRTAQAVAAWRAAGGGPPDPPGGPGPADGPGGLAGALAAILRDHALPAGASAASRPAFTWAACVHSPLYGTRSSMIVTVPQSGRPRILVTGGPPCQVPLLPATAGWDPPPGRTATAGSGSGSAELTGSREWD
jgi:uncharacterized protein with NRDE domain